MLEVRRTVGSAPGVLSIFDFTPKQGPALTTVTIQGQGFSPTAANNIVRFGSTDATVLSASNTSLVVAVPIGAASGPFSVRVGTTTVPSPGNFIVVTAPVITSINRRSFLANTTVPNLQVGGVNLGGAVFSLLPAFSPPTAVVNSVTVSNGGSVATLNVTLTAQATGTFVVLATATSGSSSPFPTMTNSFSVLSSTDPTTNSDADALTDLQEAFFGTDPLSADTDGDAFSDSEEVAAGSDPVNPSCTPLNCRVSGDVASVAVSLLNTAATPGLPREADSVTFSALNTTASAAYPREADSLTFSVLNSVNSASLLYEAYGVTFSLCNGTASPACATAASSLTSRRDAAQADAEPRADGQAAQDSDGDGIPDEVELRIGSGVFSADTDGDGYVDGLELALDSDPLDFNSVPSIRLPPEAVSPTFSVDNAAIFIAGSGRKAKLQGGLGYAPIRKRGGSFVR
jgi:hypothetical protein